MRLLSFVAFWLGLAALTGCGSPGVRVDLRPPATNADLVNGGDPLLIDVVYVYTGDDSYGEFDAKEWFTSSNSPHGTVSGQIQPWVLENGVLEQKPAMPEGWKAPTVKDFNRSKPVYPYKKIRVYARYETPMALDIDMVSRQRVIVNIEEDKLTPHVKK